MYVHMCVFVKSKYCISYTLPVDNSFGHHFHYIILGIAIRTFNQGDLVWEKNQRKKYS